MGWEKRKGKLYYFRKVRGSDGRIRSVYVGGGEVGRRAEAEDRARRDAKRDERLALRRARRRPSPPPAPEPAEVLPAQVIMPSGGAKKGLESPQIPLRNRHLVSFSAASGLISASNCSGADLIELIDGLEVDEITRLLLRRKFLQGLHLSGL